MKKVLDFTIPLWLGMIVNTLLGITDFYFLKQINFDYLTIIGIAYIPFSLLSSMMVGVGIEANRSLAKGQKFNFKIILGMIISFSVAVSIIAFKLSRNLLFFVNGHSLYLEIIEYFNILVFLLIPTSVLYLCTGLLRGLGVPKKTLKFSILAVSLNFIFDFIFIKLKLLDSPLKGCAYASIISDTLVVILYIIYLKQKGYLFLGKSDIKSLVFFKNAWSYSIEKLCSSSTVLIISSFYISKISVEDSSIYYGIDRFFKPLKMFSFCYFEWIIYSVAKNIIYNKKLVKIGYGILVSIFGVIMIFYMNLDNIGIAYLISYIIYCVIFLAERELVAKQFALGKAKKTNTIIFIKSITMLMSFHLLFKTNNLSLLTIGVIQSILLLFESLLLVRKSKF